MDGLSGRDREAIRLRDFDGLSLTETAEAFDLSESATKSCHYRARRRLACALHSMDRSPEGRETRTSRVSPQVGQ
jgi:DNA-directed RNA polymerase specialized sigma24 family protein